MNEGYDGARVRVVPDAQRLEAAHLLGVGKRFGEPVVQPHCLFRAECREQRAAHEFILEQCGCCVGAMSWSVSKVISMRQPASHRSMGMGHGTWDMGHGTWDMGN